MFHNARACTLETGGFVCIPKSHLKHEEVIQRALAHKQQSKSKGSSSDAVAEEPKKRPTKKIKLGNLYNENFIRLATDPKTGQYLDPLVQPENIFLVTAPAHSITLWLSPTIHCNYAGTRKITRDVKKCFKIQSIADLFPRSIVYAAFYRAELCESTELTRIQQFNEGITTDHSPIYATPKKSGFNDPVYTLPIQPYVPVKLTLAGKNLITSAKNHSLLNGQL